MNTLSQEKQKILDNFEKFFLPQKLTLNESGNGASATKRVTLIDIKDFLSSSLDRILKVQEEENEAIKLLEEAATYLITSNVVNTIYIPPAQQLRNLAANMERKEDFIRRLREYLQLHHLEDTKEEKGE